MVQRLSASELSELYQSPLPADQVKASPDLETTRHVSLITITLLKKELDTSSIGYQPPWPADQVKASPEFEYKGGYVEL
ncbi:hypothetical protein Tco_1087136 [Tanacetum coccineum]